MLRPLRRLLLLAALLGGYPALAQSIYYLDLAGQALTVPNRTFYIRQVVDGRPTPGAPVGTVLRGLTNTPHPASLRPSVAGALQALCDAQLPARPTDQPVLAVVRAFTVQETIGLTSEEARDDVALDFYLLDAAGQARLAASASQTVSSRGIETTGRHGRQLVRALQACLDTLTTTDWAQVAAGPALPAAELAAGRLPDPVSYPIQTDSSYRAGFYRTFEDFRRNAPVTSPALLLLADGPHLQNPDGSRGPALRGVWGFSDGRQPYIRHRNVYCPLVRQGAGFAFTGPSGPNPQTVNQAAFWGGVAGALVAAASTSGTPVRYGLDLRTGRVAPAETDQLTPLPAQTRPTSLLVYRPRAAKGPAVRVRLGPGQPALELAPGTYLQLEPTPGQPLAIGLLAPDQPEFSLSVTPSAEGAVYVECQPQRTPPLRVRPPAEGAAAVSRLVD